MKTLVAGIRPSGSPHLGTYLGVIRPAVRLAESYRTACVIADYHALPGLRERDTLTEHTYDVAAAWLACGLDPERTTLFRQSFVPETFELAWVLASLITPDELEASPPRVEALHSGAGDTAALLTYPLLMAADILLYDANEVLVGEDQRCHVEMAAVLANRLNHRFQHGTAVVPEPLLTEAPRVLGADGERMGKSRGNTIPLFAAPSELERAVAELGATEAEDPEASPLFQLYRQVTSSSEWKGTLRALGEGGTTWADVRPAVLRALEAELGPLRERYRDVRADEEALDAVLERGAKKAREAATRTMRRIRLAVGMDRIPDSDYRATVKLKV